jgi:hypothetical protein
VCNLAQDWILETPSDGVKRQITAISDPVNDEIGSSMRVTAAPTPARDVVEAFWRRL